MEKVKDVGSVILIGMALLYTVYQVYSIEFLPRSINIVVSGMLLVASMWLIKWLIGKQKGKYKYLKSQE